MIGMWIKECPFCGAEGELRQIFGFYPQYAVKCSNKDCMVRPETMPYTYEQDAVAVWNKREKNNKKEK